MFDLESLQKDKGLARLCLNLVSSDFTELGRYIDIWSVDSLIEKLAAAKYERLKYLPIRKLTVYRTSDIGLGYMNYISVNQFREFIALGMIDKDIPIHLDYKHGNVFCVVEHTDIDKKVLLTDETYLFVNEETNEIHYIKIGKPCNPNLMYYMKELDNITTTFGKAVTLPNLNSIWVETIRNSTLY